MVITISNPRHLLVLHDSDALSPRYLECLTGSRPVPVNGSLTGASHELKISNKYFQALIPIWIDDISDSEAWRKEFASDEASEVREEIACYTLVVGSPDSGSRLKQILSTMDAIGHVANLGDLDAALHLVVLPSDLTSQAHVANEEWDDFCMDRGFEFFCSSPESSANATSEIGVRAVQRSLEVLDWRRRPSSPSLASLEGAEKSQGEISPTGKSGEDRDDPLSRAYQELQHARESAKRLPETERKECAARAVDRVIKLLQI